MMQGQQDIKTDFWFVISTITIGSALGSLSWFTCWLFNDAVSSSDYTASNDRMVLTKTAVVA